MKLLKSVLSLSCLLFVHNISMADIQCDEPSSPEHVRIYFANGMNNEDFQIDNSMIALQNLVGISNNRSFGKSVNTKEQWYSQMLEVFAQKESEPSLFWEWLTDMSLSPWWFRDAFNEYTSMINNVSYALDSELRIMVNEYLQDLYSGKKVVIVAHSQGNFYANAAYQYIKDNYPKYKNSIGLIATGTPAARVQDGGWHTTNSKDLIVNLVRLRYNVLPSTGTYDEPGSLLNHNFIYTYLAGFGPRIRNHIIQTINKLETPEKDFECKDPDEVPVDVSTAYASHVSSNTAYLFGLVISGKQIDGYCIWRKASLGNAPSCEAYRDKIDTSGPLNFSFRFVGKKIINGKIFSRYFIRLIFL